MQPVLMPQIGQDITVGRIVRWHKGAMEPVRQGEVILTVESEKASFEVEAERDGVLLEILHGEGEEAEVLSPVGYIGEPGESPPGAAGAARPRGAAAAGSPAAARPAPKAPAGETGGVGEDARAVPRTGPHRTGGEPFASPSARRVAAQRGIRLEDIPGTGPRGRIVKQDVLRAAAAAPAEHDTEIPFTGVRRVVAERLSLSSRTIPHFYLFQDIDMGAAFAFRETTNRREREHVTITALVAYAAIQALRRFPRLNAHVEEDRLVLKARIDLGVAVDSERGLVVPVIRSADSLGLGELAASLARVSSEARRGRLDPGARGSFTVSSLGMHGVPAFLPLINPPECAILAVGAVEERVTARGGSIAVRPLMTVVLGCDHRAVDGAEAAGFLRELKDGLENGFVAASGPDG